MIIWADPDQKEVIFKKTVEDKTLVRKINLENKYVALDPKLFFHNILILFSIKAIFENSIPCRSVSNQNYRMYMDSFAEEEQRKIDNVMNKMK